MFTLVACIYWGENPCNKNCMLQINFINLLKEKPIKQVGANLIILFSTNLMLKYISGDELSYILV